MGWIFLFKKKSPGTTPEFPLWCRQPLTAAPCAVPTCCLSGTSCVPKEGHLQCTNAPGESKFGEEAWTPQESFWIPQGSISGGEEQQRKGSSWESLLDRAIPQSSSLGRLKVSSPILSGNISCPDKPSLFLICSLLSTNWGPLLPCIFHSDGISASLSLHLGD